MKEDNIKKDTEDFVERYVETKDYISLTTRNGRIYWRQPKYKNFV